MVRMATGAVRAMLVAGGLFCVSCNEPPAVNLPAGTRAGQATGHAAIARADADLAALHQKVPDFVARPLPPDARLVELKPEHSLTIEQLRNVDLDDAPPALGPRSLAYDRRMADDCPPDRRPYVAAGIRPFRFRHFNCEFNIGGWHNYDMQDYAATRGFNIIYPYVRKIEEVGHWPKGTKILHWGGFVNWHEWMPRHGIPNGRYDQFAGIDLLKLHLAEGSFDRARSAGHAHRLADYLMIDQEHPVLPPAQLREQAWYPKDAPQPDRTAFEARYYDGYAQTYLSSVAAARQSGWENISIYGWYPYGRTWGGLEKVEAEPGTDQAWTAFGRRILDAVDIVNNSVYCFYWTPQNVAYTLANIDVNRAMVNSSANPKPIRPYYCILLHGGGGGWRWWRNQPIASEEKRAMIAMSFFTGVDGFDTWCWSGTASLHTVAFGAMEKQPDGTQKWQGHEVMVGRSFRAASDKGAERQFRRYDVLHVLGVDDTAGTVRFQPIRPQVKGWGVGEDHPTFTMPQAELRGHLRPKSEPVAAMIEGMALVKPLEYLLRHGQVKIDIPAQRQFGQNLPVVRRVKLDRWHVLITYDPHVIYGGPPRTIELPDFDGVPGRVLRLPADEQTRVFVLEEP